MAKSFLDSTSLPTWNLPLVLYPSDWFLGVIGTLDKSNVGIGETRRGDLHVGLSDSENTTRFLIGYDISDIGMAEIEPSEAIELATL